MDHFTLDGTFKNVTNEQKTLDLYRFTFAQHYDHYPAITSHCTMACKFDWGCFHVEAEQAVGQVQLKGEVYTRLQYLQDVGSIGERL